MEMDPHSIDPLNIWVFEYMKIIICRTKNPANGVHLGVTISSSENDGVLQADFLNKASTIIKTLGHPQRILIINLLRDSEQSVTSIQEKIGLSQPVTSQHLALMRSRGILSSRKDGTTHYYSIANPFIEKILECVTECQEKVESGEWSGFIE